MMEGAAAAGPEGRSHLYRLRLPLNKPSRTRRTKPVLSLAGGGRAQLRPQEAGPHRSSGVRSRAPPPPGPRFAPPLAGVEKNPR